MCGIVAYVGNKQVAPLLVEGLKRLEYRGYDSAGLAVAAAGRIKIVRTVGRVSVLESYVDQTGGFEGTLGIAHTRWATHGGPSESNAHPHTGTTKDGLTIAVVHNGIIENYTTLRKYLADKGHEFTSETDTEVIAKLVAELYEDDLESAVQSAMREVTGAYAIGVICEAEPHTLVCARKGSPLIVGIAENSYVVASDASAIVNIPPQQGDTALHSPNSRGVQAVMLQALQAVLKDRPITNAFQVILPDRTDAEVYAQMLPKLGQNAMWSSDGQTKGLPIVAVTQVRI